MSSRLVDLCVAILEDHFGFYISHVGSLLLRQQLPLLFLAKQLGAKKITLREVKRSLTILDQHNLLLFESTPRAILYSICPQHVLQLIRAPRAILVVKTLYEGIAEAIFEDILSQGKSSCSDSIRRVSRCLDNLAFEKVKTNFVRLTAAQILIRCEKILIEEDSSIPAAFPIYKVDTDPFLMPDVILDSDEKVLAGENGMHLQQSKTTNGDPNEIEGHQEQSLASRKRKYLDEKTANKDSDAQILWRINWTRMERFFRDECILDALGGGGNELLEDKQALRVTQLLLKVGEVKSTLYSGQSTPIALQDVCRYVREHQIDFGRDLIDEKLNIIGRDTAGIVRKLGDSSGGLYIINYEKGIESLCLEHIESAIREKIGDSAVRIFRLLRYRGFLEEEQVEKEAMLSTKETKELCCALMDDGFITTRQIARANDFAPARTIFLYFVNMAQVLNSMLHFTTGAIRNVIRRRIVEREKHELLLERQLKMEVIINSIQNNPEEEDEEAKKEQIADVEQTYMTAEDRRQLERFKHAERRFWSTEIELERVHFALQQFQEMRQRTNLEQRKEALQAKRKGGGRAAKLIKI